MAADFENKVVTQKSSRFSFVSWFRDYLYRLGVWLSFWGLGFMELLSNTSSTAKIYHYLLLVIGPSSNSTKDENMKRSILHKVFGFYQNPVCQDIKVE